MALRTAINRAYIGIQSQCIRIINVSRIGILEFYADSYIEDLIIAGSNTFHQRKKYWLTMLILLIGLIIGLFIHDILLYYLMYTEVINPVGPLLIIKRYLTNKPSRKAMMRIHKRISNEELFDIHALMMVLVYLGMIIIFFGFFLYMCRNYLFQRAVRRERRLKLSTLEKIKYSTDHRWETCIICQSEYNDNDILYVLPCSHAFHLDCTNNLISAGGQTCPLCRRDAFDPIRER